MKVVLRAATHLDWTPSEPAGNRYAETVSVYYTLAWFDRYLRGAGDPAVADQAFRRLTADRFDDYADRHNISQGLYDPARAAAHPDDPYAGNVPVHDRRRSRPQPDVVLLPVEVFDHRSGRVAPSVRGHACRGLPGTQARLPAQICDRLPAQSHARATDRADRRLCQR